MAMAVSARSADSAAAVTAAMDRDIPLTLTPTDSLISRATMLRRRLMRILISRATTLRKSLTQTTIIIFPLTHIRLREWI